MTCEGNKKGCNNKILISTLMLASMVCILSVSDMLGMLTPKRPINPYEAMKRIKGDPKYYKEFMEIFKGHEGLIKRNCCCGDIDIENTKLPKKEGEDKFDITLDQYINDRFILSKEGDVHFDTNFSTDYVVTCKALDELILKIYNKPSSL